MVIQYKCPNCGADMVFDAKSGTLFCESCQTSLSASDLPKANQNTSSDTPADSSETQKNAVSDEDEIKDFEEFESQTQAGTFGEEEASQYQCNNCGAILITDKHTSATTCSFCGAPMILGNRLSGELAPAKVIPFSIPKEEAIAAFKKWCKNGRFSPPGFASAERIKNISGIYVPFWLYDLRGQGEMNAHCTRVRTYDSGDYIVTETSHFDVFRRVDLKYTRIPVDASEKMNDTLMDKLEPFHYEDMKDFNTPYLAGYLAEKYNYTDEELFPRIKQRVARYVEDYIHSTILGYATTQVRHKDIQVKQQNAVYALFPIWMICYDYSDSEHVFAMNGQTGKIVGKPPISKKKVFAWFAGISVSIFAILELLTILTGGLL